MAINTDKYIHKIKTNLWADSDYRVFFYSFKANSKKYRGLITTKDKPSWKKKDRVTYAETQLVSIKRKREDNIVDDKLTLNEMFIKHIQYHEDGRWKVDKINFYNFNIKSKPLGRMSIINIRPVHIKEAMQVLRDRGLKPRSVSRIIEVLRPIFKEAMDNRVIEYNPLSNLKVKRYATKKIVVNAVEEFKLIYEAIQNEFFHDPFYKAFFAFAMQGRRRTEIMTLKWENISFKYNYYVLRDTKNNEEQKIFLPQRIKDLLLEFISSENEYIFTSRYTGSHITSIQFQINKLKKRTKKPEFCLHYLRNVIVSAMAEEGIESIHLSGALGHNDPNTIKKYLTMNYLKSSEMASGVIDGIVKK